MTRRLVWLGLGAAAGSGATVWVRRRVDRLAARVNPAEVPASVVAMVDRRARSTADRFRQSVDTGRRAARRRAYELRRDNDAGSLTP